MHLSCKLERIAVARVRDALLHNWSALRYGLYRIVQCRWVPLHAACSANECLMACTSEAAESISQVNHISSIQAIFKPCITCLSYFSSIVCQKAELYTRLK